MRHFPHRRSVLAGLSASIALPPRARAQGAFDGRTVTMIVPFPPGGGTDVVARVLADRLSAATKGRFVIENRPGGGGSIGYMAAVRAPADGSTVMLTSSAITTMPFLYPTKGYDPKAELTPVSLIGSGPSLVCVGPHVPVKTLRDLVDLAKAKPGELTYGSTGIGGGGHLAGELFALMTGTKLTHVPSRASPAALTDLLAGRLSFTFETVITSVPLVAEGKLPAYAVTGPKRASAFPDVPTLDELGLKGFEITQWQGLFAPAGTDKAIIAKLNETMNQALRAPDVIERLGTQGGNDIVGGSPEDFARVIQADLARYGKLIKDANIKVLE